MPRYASFTIRKDIKSKWLKALRSGKYEQGADMLHNPYNNTYCCLGVLCSVAGVVDAKLDRLGFPESVDGENFSGNKWQVPCLGRMYSLPSLNDAEGLSFEQIAGIIEHTVQTH